jgi:hypothetical protein
MAMAGIAPIAEAARKYPCSSISASALCHLPKWPAHSSLQLPGLDGLDPVHLVVL